MTAENPLLLGTDIMLADVWTEVATNVQRGFVHIKKGDLVYFQTHRLTGEAKPDDLILPGDPLFEGVAMYYRNERIAGETVVVGGDGINSSAPRDVYIYCWKEPGIVRVDIGI